MKSITIHGIDDSVYEVIKNKAKAEGKSINKTVKKILEEATGVKPAESMKHESEFVEFLSVWTKEDLEEFKKNTRDFEGIDEEEWK